MDSSDIHKILVIRFRRIGDAVISSAICSSLKKTFPKAEVHYVLNEGIAPLFEHHPDIDKLITFNEAELGNIFVYLKKIYQLVRTEKYDIIIDTRSTFKTIFFSWFSLRTNYRIGIQKSASYTAIAHNHHIVDNTLAGENILDFLLKFLDPLKDEFEIQKVRDFKLYVTPEEKNDFGKYMESHGIKLSEPTFFCTSATRVVHQSWHTDRVAQILNKIVDKYPTAQFIFNYNGEREKQNAQEVCDLIEKKGHTFIEIQANTLRELSAMLANTNFFFGNEGGPRHIAQANGIPSFTVYPPNVKKYLWLPQPSEWNQGIEVDDINPEAANSSELTHEEKFDLVDVDSVWHKLEVMLNKYISKP